MRRLKQLAVVGLAALMVLGVVPAASADPVSFTDLDGISYIADSGYVEAGATVTGYTGGSNTVSIPAAVSINGTEYTVTSIGNSAFFSKGLTSVTIPDGVTDFGVAAFANNGLTTVTIPDGVTDIGAAVFANNGLTSVTIPDGVTSIGSGAFETNALTSVTIPDGVTFIGDAAFYLNALTSVTIPDSVEHLGPWAFSFNNLTSVSLGNGLSEIGAMAFYSNALTSVTVPDSVWSISSGAFARNSLTSVNIGSGVTDIWGNAFGSNQLKSVTIPGSIAIIGDIAFYNNPLESVQFLGMAPTSSMGQDALGSLPGPLVSYFVRYEVPYSFTSPTWKGYATQALAQVTYDTTGGSTAPTQATVAVGSNVTEPAEPTMAGHTFIGWFTAATGGTAWDFTSPVSADTTLYAQWAGPVFLTDSNGIVYSADSGDVDAGATVTHYIGSAIVSIPATVTIDGTAYDVTSIGSFAFDLKGLTSVTIPDSVTSIEDFAFYSNRLTSVTIPDSVTSIGAYAFTGNRLTSVTIPDSVTSIGSRAFYGNQMTSVQFLGAAPTAVGLEAFGTSGGLQLSYLQRYGSPAVTGGFTTPTWTPAGTTDVYHTQALAQVTYDTTGGSTAPAQATVTVGDTVTEPAAPTWAGHTFTGWFTAATGGTAWDFTSPVSADITLYAQWTGPVSLIDSNGIVYNADSGDVDAGATVTGYTGSSTSVSVPATVTIDGIQYSVTAIGTDAFRNTGLTSVTIPGSVASIGDRAFDENGLGSVQFLGAVPTTVGSAAFGTNDRVLVSYLPQYGSSVVAGGFTFPTWTPAGTSDVYNTYAIANVTFDTTGGSTAPAPVAVNSDGTATSPADPTWAGHTFTGWFTAATGGTAWDFTSRVGADTTLYAQWATVTPPVVVPPLVDDAPPAMSLTVNLEVGSPIGNAPVVVSGAGLLANSPWSLVLHSTPTTVASGTTTGTGTFAGTFSLPASIPAGAHTLTLTGTAPDGSAVIRVVYLTVSDAGTLDYLSTQGPQVLAATGVDTPVDGLVSGALFLLILGAVLIWTRRRRRTVR